MLYRETIKIAFKLAQYKQQLGVSGLCFCVPCLSSATVSLCLLILQVEKLDNNNNHKPPPPLPPPPHTHTHAHKHTHTTTTTLVSGRQCHCPTLTINPFWYTEVSSSAKTGQSRVTLSVTNPQHPLHCPAQGTEARLSRRGSD